MNTITVFGREIPLYGLMGATGVVLSIVYLAIMCRIKKKSFDDSIYVLIWACVAAIIGAKLLYLLVECRTIAEQISTHRGEVMSVILTYISGGFVFYGGLFGAFVGVKLACRYFKLDFAEQMNFCTPVIPLIHGFGRLGCHLVGCCYGMEYTGVFARVYTESAYAPNGVGLFPVQIIESMFDFALFLTFVILTLRKKCENKFIYIYLISYSTVRFVLEFFRGDEYRGSLFGVSTSQWISIAIWIFVAVRAIRITESNKKQSKHSC